jgi:aminopeptidase N
LPEQPRFRSFLQARLQPVAARLGWEARADDPVNSATQRHDVLTLLGRSGDPATIAEARAYFARLVKGETLEPGLRRTILTIVAENADETSWEQLHHLARTAASLLEKTEYYLLLGQVQDQKLAVKALQLGLSGEAEPTTAPGIIRAVANHHPSLAVKFASEHWSALEPMLETMARHRYVPEMAYGASDPTILSTLAAFAKAHIPPSGEGELRKVRAQIRTNIEVRGHSLPEINHWLTQQKPMM